MHHHTGRLVDHQQVGVLVDHRQRDLLRFDLRFDARRPQQGDGVAGREPGAGLAGPAVDRHPLLLDPALHLHARGIDQLLGQKAVQPLAAQPHRKGQLLLVLRWHSVSSNNKARLRLALECAISRRQAVALA
jgi:hypothetical protein